MIEQFCGGYDRFFDEPHAETRWERLKEIHAKDYLSFRVLFLVETMALLDQWREPTPAELNKILQHVIGGDRIAIRIGRIIDLLQPVWPLEVAKYDVLVYRATLDGDFRKRYVMTWIRSYATALVQAWWSFETMMNDFAGIIATERKDQLDPATLGLLHETRPTIDKAGGITMERYYQPLLPRLQFIYKVLTGETLDRGTKEWKNLVELKDARDIYVHRIGKQVEANAGPTQDLVVKDGFLAVRDVLSRVLTKTPEFTKKFVYRYLAWWSCGLDSPFIWDGSEGQSFYLGLGGIEKKMISGLFAPMPGSFSTAEEQFGSVNSNRDEGREAAE